MTEVIHHTFIKKIHQNRLICNSLANKPSIIRLQLARRIESFSAARKTAVIRKIYESFTIAVITRQIYSRSFVIVTDDRQNTSLWIWDVRLWVKVRVRWSDRGDEVITAHIKNTSMAIECRQWFSFVCLFEGLLSIFTIEGKRFSMFV